jgi:hypothetical protein
MATDRTEPKPGEVWRLGILTDRYGSPKATVIGTRRDDRGTLIVLASFYHAGRKETMELWATDLTRRIS